MDLLLEAAILYRNLINKEFIITFSNNQTMRLIFKDANFVHLAGLKKLSDLEFLKNLSARYIYKMILKGQLILEDINNSIHFNAESRERIESLCRIGELLVKDGLAVYGFDKSLCRAKVSFKSDVIFYKEDGYDFFITFGAATDKSGEYHYPETIFYRYDMAYLLGQNVVSIESIEVKPYIPTRVK